MTKTNRANLEYLLLCLQTELFAAEDEGGEEVDPEIDEAIRQLLSYLA